MDLLVSQQPLPILLSLIIPHMPYAIVALRQRLLLVMTSSPLAFEATFQVTQI
jgi:hypothetical protein